MSFFNSLQQYVTNSVANLNLSPKRFSLSREGSNGSGEGPPPSSPGGRSASAGCALAPPSPGGPLSPHSPHSPGAAAAHHGFPKVVPPPGTSAPQHARSLSARRRTLDCSASPTLGLGVGAGVGGPHARRIGSFRRQPHAQSAGGAAGAGAGPCLPAPRLAFCRRRQSWPEVDQQATSG